MSGRDATGAEGAAMNGGHAVTRAQLARCVALGFFPSVVTMLIGPFLTVHLVEQRHFGVAAAAALIGATTLLNSLLGLVSGHLVDRIDRTIAARAGLVLIALLPIALLLEPPTALLIAAIALYGFGGALFDHSAAATIYAGNKDSAAAKEAYSYYYAAHNGGTMLSPLVVYWLGSGGHSGTFAAALVVHAAVTAWYFAAFRRGAAAPAPQRPKPAPRGRFAHPLPVLVAFGLLYSLTYSQFFTTLPVVLSDLRLLDRPIYPLLLALNGLLVIAFQQLYVPLSRRLDSRRSLLAGAVALLASYLLLLGAAHRVEAVLLFAVAFTLAEVFINLSATDLIFNCAPAGRQTSWLSIYQASRLSGGLGIAAGGALLAQHGAATLHGAFVLTALPMVAIAAALTLRARRPVPA